MEKANSVLYKEDSRQNPLIYRPASFTSVVNKTIEEAIRKNVEHLEKKYVILYERQFGFRKGQSCASNICYYNMAQTVEERDG